MTRCTLTFLLCVCASFFLNAQCPPPNDRDAPVFACDSAVYCFDTVTAGTVIEHRFRFSNTGATPLLIQNVFVATGMLVAESPREPIMPGGSGVIRVTLNTSGKSGPIDKVVSIESNNRSGTVLLRLKGFVIRNAPKGPVLTFDSASYSFDTIAPGTIISHEYRFTNTGDAPLIISNVVTNCGCLIPEWPKEPIPARGTGVIRLTYNSTGKTGAQYKTATISCNTAEGITSIQMSGYVSVTPANRSNR